jgi:two-component system capsular synthesis sensor histidine kinase RcsC
LLPVTGRQTDGGTILVAEDNPLNQTLIAEQLETIGWKSIVVDDGQQALIALEHSDFDLVLTHIHMPVMDGYELLAAIEAKRPALPVLAFSAVTPSGQAIDWEARGFAGYVAKPASLNELERALRAVRPHAPSDAHTPVPPSDDRGAVVMPDTERERYRALLREHLRTDEPELAGILLRRDIPALGQWAHRSAGALLIVGADDIVKLCRAVGRLCEDDSEWTSGLHAEATTLLDAVRGYRAGSGRPEVTEAS